MTAPVAIGALACGCGLRELIQYIIDRWKQAREEDELSFRASLNVPLSSVTQSERDRLSTVSSLQEVGNQPRRWRRWQSLVVADVVRAPVSPAGAQSQAMGAFRSMSKRAPDDSDEVSRSMSQDLVSIKFWDRHADPQAVARENVVVPMVGLPARGKSYISGAIIRHLHLLGVRAKSFNAGALRRDEGKAGISADFFAADNKDGKATRDRLAMECCDSMLSWLDEAADESCSSVAILDATNTTVERRRAVMQRCSSWMEEKLQEDPLAVPLRVLFLESVCDDGDILEQNYEMKKLNDDYKDKGDANAGLEDFKKRVQAYEAQYCPLDDAELDDGDNGADGADGGLVVQVPVGSIRVINGGVKLECYRTGHSLVAAPVIQLLHAMHLTRRRIVLVPEDEATPEAVAAFMLKVEGEEDGRPMDVICSASEQALVIAEQLELINHHESLLYEVQPRAVLTLAELGGPNKRFDGNSSPGLLQSPASSRRRGERFADVVRRMREVILLIERLPRSVLIVCHKGEPWKVLLAHFQGCPQEVSPIDLPLPMGPIVELRRDHKGFSLQESPWPSTSS
mmetsp:Transcript_60212/g.111625  ORF Transcript_60212/g.111625 Transcript_60212/m.111625 type:complete len:569 (+) Transcript_60212:105-1811(+)